MAVKKKRNIAQRSQPADAIAKTIEMLDAWAERWFKHGMPEQAPELAAFRKGASIEPDFDSW